MNKIKNRIIVPVIFLLGIGYFVLSVNRQPEYKADNIDEKSSQLSVIVQQELSLENKSGKHAINLSAIDEPTQVNNADQTIVNHKIPYEGEWCIKGVDLSVDDFNFALKEEEDWGIQQGQFSLKQVHSTIEAPELVSNSELLEPYREMDKDELMELALNDDRYAMMVILQRSEASFDESLIIAQRLTFLGDTAFSLVPSMAYELAQAEAEYKKVKTISTAVKQHLINALTYVSYGISRYSSTALSSYLGSVNSDELYHPMHSLTADDFDIIRSNVIKMQGAIDKARSQENFPLLSQQDIPKIARHKFQEEIALLYMEHGKELDTLQLLNNEGSPSIGRTDCVRRYQQLFG